MRRVRRKAEQRQATERPTELATQFAIPLDDGTLATPGNPVMLALIQALIPLGLRAVGDALQAEVTALAGERHIRGAPHPEVVRWGKQKGAIFLADQKLAVAVPRVRDRK